MKLVLLPLEPLEQRYTEQWSRWIPEELTRLKANFITVNGTALTSKIELGSVLDAYGTNYWKATQMANLIELMHCGEVTSEDVLFFYDLWSPGIEALRYISNMGGEAPMITGVLHAGTWDEHDFLVRNNLRPVFHSIESSWFDMFDVVFLGSAYHRRLILASHSVDPNKLVVTGLPFYPDEFTTGRKWIEKEPNMVVFPHRLDNEKHPEQFDALIANHPEWIGCLTMEEFTTKDKYYDALAKSTIAVSCADQETFGYAMLEATALGCIPLVPDKLSYKELFCSEFRYRTLYDLESRIEYILSNLTSVQQEMQFIQETHKEIGKSAIRKMWNTIRSL